MREVRLSIPVIGGITVVYTGEEIEAKKQAMKKHMCAGVAHVSRFCSSVISSIANKIEVKKTTIQVALLEGIDVANPCPACGVARVDGVCKAHGKR